MIVCMPMRAASVICTIFLLIQLIPVAENNSYADSHEQEYPGCVLTAYEPYTEYEGSQLFFMHIGAHDMVMSPNAQCPRYALSLAKLFIADYVLRYGNEDSALINEMITASDDDIATELYNLYPDSIDVVAEEYHLHATRGGDLWGNTVTSAYDIAQFLAAKMTNKDDPLLLAMENMQPIAMDGYNQDFGTVLLPGVQGTKLGWGSNLDMHSSVSFGTDASGYDFIAVASTFGDKESLNSLVSHYIEPYIVHNN